MFLKKLILAVFAATLTLHAVTAADGDGPLQFLEDKYNDLSPRGKFVATAAVGFVGTRVAVNTAMGVIKFGVAAFITTEVLEHTGVLKNFPPLSNEQSEMISDVKEQVLRRANTFRTQVRRRLGPDAFQYLMENERIGALGLAGGAFVGTLI